MEYKEVIKVKDYYGYVQGVKPLGIVTMKEFADEYEKLANSKDKIPVASNVIPLKGAEGCTRYRKPMPDDEREPEYEACIFYKYKPQDNRVVDPATGKVVVEKKLKLKL